MHTEDLNAQNTRVSDNFWGEVSLLGALEDSTAPNAVSRVVYTRSHGQSRIWATDTLRTRLFLQSFAAWRKDANNQRRIASAAQILVNDINARIDLV